MSASSETPVDTGESAVVEIPVLLPAHLHARPAGRIAQAAARFTSTLLLQYGERTANPRGVLGVMALGATAVTSLMGKAIPSTQQSSRMIKLRGSTPTTQHL